MVLAEEVKKHAVLAFVRKLKAYITQGPPFRLAFIKTNNELSHRKKYKCYKHILLLTRRTMTHSTTN